MRTAEVVIVGGGVIGASVAHHLAARGCRDVLVLERAAGPGGGSTGRATGGFRAQFATEVNVRLSLLSREKLLSFEAETGVDPGFRQRGYLFLARDEAQLGALLAAQAVQHACGLREARRVGAAEVGELNPAVESRGLAGGVFCPTDGFIRPLEILRGYAESAARAGVRFEWGAEVVGFRRGAGGEVVSVLTGGEEFAAAHVVNAAGAWAARVAELAGVRLPVRPLRRQVAVTEACDLLPEEMPMTIFVEDGFHLRVRDGRVLLLWPDDARAADPFDTSVDDRWLSEVTARAHARVPCTRGALIERASCWAGLYEVTPDKHAVVGRAPGVENFYLANGSSGHGVMHAPALGQLLSELILDGAPKALDLHALRPTRFDEGEPNVAPDYL
ncbi:MAG TPA: FAD-dependent oxidoreductase [Pyrinomonadaceae bacterium]|nr:FAD-dependent oxidoreductase [Pyrinomonadaceae bacterium]